MQKNKRLRWGTNISLKSVTQAQLPHQETLYTNIRQEIIREIKMLKIHLRRFKHMRWITEKYRQRLSELECCLVHFKWKEIIHNGPRISKNKKVKPWSVFPQPNLLWPNKWKLYIMKFSPNLSQTFSNWLVPKKRSYHILNMLN